MTDYFITIISQQRRNKVRQQELEDVQFWLSANGVRFICRRYESTGMYNQLHFHGIARFVGRYQGLVSWGDEDHTDNTYHIRWQKVTNYKNLITYILKDGSREANSPFSKTLKRSKQYINIFPATRSGVEGRRREHCVSKPGRCPRSNPSRDTLSNILKRTL